jgi:predicted RNase H-like HicB family nuclease
MSVRSKESAKAIDRPIATETLRQAEKIADRYQVVLHCDEGHWYGRGLELPNVFGDGKTVGRCIAETRTALCGAVAWMLEEGRKPPHPARETTRTRQVNVRLTAEEKLVLESTAKRRGFKGLGDFLRAAALEAVG